MHSLSKRVELAVCLAACNYWPWYWFCRSVW